MVLKIKKSQPYKELGVKKQCKQIIKPHNFLAKTQKRSLIQGSKRQKYCKQIIKFQKIRLSKSKKLSSKRMRDKNYFGILVIKF